MARRKKHISSQAGRLWKTANLLRVQGHFELAKDLFLELLESPITLNNPTLRVDALNELVICQRALDEYEDAIGYAWEAFEIAELHQYMLGKGEAFHNLGAISHLSGGDEALAYFRAAIKIMEHVGNSAGVARSLLHIGMMARDQGKFEKAEGDFSTAYNLFQASLEDLDPEDHLEVKQGSLRSLTQLALTKLTKKDPSQALESCKKALDLAEEVAQNNRLATIHRLMALTYWLLGVPHKSKIAFQHAIDEASRASRSQDLAFTYQWGGVFFWESDDPTTAFDYLSESLNHWRLLSNIKQQSNTLFFLVGLSFEAFPDQLPAFLVGLEQLWQVLARSNNRKQLLLQIELARVFQDNLKAKARGYSFGLTRKYERVLRLARNHHQTNIALLTYPFLLELLIPDVKVSSGITDANKSQVMTLVSQLYNDLDATPILNYQFVVIDAIILVFYELDFKKALEKLKPVQAYFRTKQLHLLSQRVEVLAQTFVEKLKLLVDASGQNNPDKMRELAHECQSFYRSEISNYLKQFKFNCLLYTGIIPTI